MPTYDHICKNKECNHEWEDSYSIKLDPPKICPKCGQETAERLISCMSKGVVELTGHELTEKLNSDVKQLKKDMHKSEKIYSNMLGESKYEKIQTQMDRQRRR